MKKIGIIINQPKEVEKIPIELLNKKNVNIIALDYPSHKKLERENIIHKIIDDYLDEVAISKLFEFTTTKYKWFKEMSLAKKFEFKGINIFEIMDRQEFHEDVLSISKRGYTITKFLENQNFSNVICSKQFKEFIEYHFSNLTLNLFEETSEDSLIYDNIDLKFDIGKKVISKKISKNTYLFFKNIFENIICNCFRLWYKPNSKKIIVLVEFNPTVFLNLISKFNENDFQVIFLNFRRSAIWNIESLKIMIKTKANMFKTNFSFSKTQKNILEDFEKNLDTLFERSSKNYDEFLKIFEFEEISFWPLLQKKMKKTFKNRIKFYLEKIWIIEKICSEIKPKFFFCLNETGETETVLLKIKKTKTKTILLQHAFKNFHNETEKDRIEIDEMRYEPLKSDKFFVWGEKDKDYYSKMGIENSKIISVGSPRYDNFSKINKKASNKKTVLITPEPITEYSGHGTIALSEKYDNTIKKIVRIINELHDVQIIVKLHPGQNQHNFTLIKLFNEINPEIPVYQLTSSKELIIQCDLLLNITCESFDPSTIMLEGLILDKPVLEISLDKKIQKYQNVNNEGIILISEEDDLEQYLKQLLFNEEFLKYNSKIRKEFLNSTLSNFDKASTKISKLLKDEFN